MLAPLPVVDASERASCGLVDEAISSAHAGVDVPIPTPVLSPEFGLIEEKELVDVDHLELLFVK
jgi:hypothetical protein